MLRSVGYGSLYVCLFVYAWSFYVYESVYGSMSVASMRASLVVMRMSVNDSYPYEYMCVRVSVDVFEYVRVY